MDEKNTDDEHQFTDAEVKAHIDLIILWMMEYGGLEKSVAVKRFENANLVYTDSGEQSWTFFHEEPYYWAMHLLLGFDNIEWYQDRELWPIPKAYRVLEEKYDKGEITL